MSLQRSRAACRHFVRDLVRDERGVVGPLIAVMGVAMVGAAGLALDVGLYYTENRKLRSATEAAALAAAMNPTAATSRAQDYLSRNGYDASVIKKVEVGYYCADSVNHAAGARFVTVADAVNCPGSSATNAVRLTTGKASRKFLTGVLGGAGPIPDLTATASAARIDEAGIAVTSDLLSLTAGGITGTLVGAVNGLLGTLLGIPGLNLSGTDIYALMNNNVDAGRFFDALAKRTGQTGTYYQLTQGTYGIQDIAYAAADAAYSTSTATALKNFAGAVSNGYKVPLADLFGLGVWKNMPVGGSDADPGPHLRAGLNAYQLIAFAAQAGPGAIDLSHVVSLIVPNSVVAIRGVGTGKLDRPRFAFGPTGEAKAGSALLRLQLDVQLTNLNVANIVSAKATVPLVIDVAAADAYVGQIDCGTTSEQKTQTKVTVFAKAGLVNVYLGTLKNSKAMTKPVPTISAADFDTADLFSLNLLFLPIVSVKGKAFVQPVTGTSGYMPVVFGPQQAGLISSSTSIGRGVTVGNKLQLAATVTGLSNSLLNDPDFRACTLSLICVNSNTSVIQSVSGVLTVVGNVLGSTADPLLDNVLAALGVQLGSATVWTTGVRCGAPVLIS